MTTPGTYLPSSSQRARDQVARYEATDGAEGGELNGLPVVILATYGASTGALRKTPIMKVIDDAGGAGDYIAIASYAGAPDNPAWYRNLRAHPDALIRDGASLVPVRAVEVSGAEKDRLWQLADRLNPAYAGYRAKAGRDIPVLRLRCAEASAPGPAELG